MSDISGERSGEFRFGIPAGISRHIMLSLAPRYIAAWPDVSLRISETGSAAVEQRLKSGALDMGLLRSAGVDPALESVCVERDHLVLAAGAESDFARSHPEGTAVSFADTRGCRFLVKRRGNRTRAVFEALCQANQVAPQILFEFEQYATAVLTASSCGALMLTAASSLRDQPELRGRVRLYEIRDFSMRYDRFICWPKSLRLTRYMLAWLELLKEFYANRAKKTNDAACST
ncbi:MAG: LysR family transcriptional regulator substrate-binding protein [Pyramidobacter sp.]|nr:LysR family transcriptional regulator substrate-binding protein [Pyramidobacter sp.]